MLRPTPVSSAQCTLLNLFPGGPSSVVSTARAMPQKVRFQCFGSGSAGTSSLNPKAFPNAAAFYAYIRRSTGGGIANRVMRL